MKRIIGFFAALALGLAPMAFAQTQTTPSQSGFNNGTPPNSSLNDTTQPKTTGSDLGTTPSETGLPAQGMPTQGAPNQGTPTQGVNPGNGAGSNY